MLIIANLLECNQLHDNVCPSCNNRTTDLPTFSPSWIECKRCGLMFNYRLSDGANGHGWHILVRKGTYAYLLYLLEDREYL